MPLTVYNTLTRQKETFVPLNPENVRMYVCGMTVYDYCHLGHARVMMVFDMIARWLRQSGYPLTYVRNITDIDDKIIARAAENGETIGELTTRFIAAMHEDADALGVIRPDVEPKATEHVAQMIAMIERLIANGKAYAAENGDVYYAVREFPAYGQLSGKSLDDLRAGERVEVDSFKRDPLTNDVLPILEDKDNHVIDALRYMLEGLRRAVRPSQPAKSGNPPDLWGRAKREESSWKTA